MKAIRIFIFVFFFGVIGLAAEEPAVSPEETTEESAVVPTPEAAAEKKAPAPISTEPRKNTEVPNSKTTTDASSAWALGIQVGESFTNISEGSFDQKNSISVGGLLEWRLAESWFVQAELNYVDKGYATTGGLIPTSTVSLKYLEMPIFLKAKQRWNNLAPYILAGPSIGYLHSASANSLLTSIDTTSNTERFEYGLYVGVGLDIVLSDNLEIGGGVRYGWGLSNINTDLSTQSVFNRNLHLMGGIKFKI